VKVSDCSPVRMNRVEPVLAILKIALKCWIETIRICSVNPLMLQQTELDVHAIRLELPAALHWERCNDEQKVVHALLEEIVNSTGERCSVSTDSLHSLTDYELTDLYQQYQYEQQQLIQQKQRGAS